jgi:outer membrane protein OmpA-like peptidoglycan-associated protein
MKADRLTILLAMLPTLLLAQDNLVYNASFEDNRECPRKIEALGVLTIVEGWYQPTAGSADYYNVCGSKDCGVPGNKLGHQPARSGNAYCGIYCSKTTYREYLQTELKEPLKKGAKYRVSYWVNLSSNSNCAVSSMGALLTTERVTDTVKGVLMARAWSELAPGVRQSVATYYKPQVVSDALLADTAEWMEVSGEITAEGGERFLTIGNFHAAGRSGIEEVEWVSGLLGGAYYYIDDVEIRLVAEAVDTMEEKESEPQATEAVPTVGETLTLREIYFQYDKTTLLQQSYNELQRLLRLLEANPKMRIEIGGHTDSKGSVEYNQRLSEGRAKAVADYLIEHGINAKRLEFKGYGKSRPIDDNDSEEGRARNRRVEIKVLSR